MIFYRQLDFKLTNKEKIALTFIGLSTLIWLAMFATPFLPITIGEKAALGSACFVIAEILFWIGLVVGGKTFASRLSLYFKLNTWKKRFLKAPPDRQLNKDENHNESNLRK